MAQFRLMDWAVEVAHWKMGWRSHYKMAIWNKLIFFLFKLQNHSF